MPQIVCASSLTRFRVVLRKTRDDAEIDWAFWKTEEGDVTDKCDRGIWQDTRGPTIYWMAIYLTRDRKTTRFSYLWTFLFSYSINILRFQFNLIRPPLPFRKWMKVFLTPFHFQKIKFFFPCSFYYYFIFFFFIFEKQKWHAKFNVVNCHEIILRQFFSFFFFFRKFSWSWLRIYLFSVKNCGLLNFPFLFFFIFKTLEKMSQRQTVFYWYNHVVVTKTEVVNYITCWCEHCDLNCFHYFHGRHSKCDFCFYIYILYNVQTLV